MIIVTPGERAIQCNFDKKPSSTVLCKYCSTSLTVTPGERAIQCTQCNGVTRIRRSSRIPLPAPPMLVVPLMSFPHSRGKKRAVLIGISYARMRRGSGQLDAINDVKCMRQLLCQRFGFPSDCIIMLIDDQKDPLRLPTKDNIRMAMHWLVQGCCNGDSLVFHFSGMGTQVPDEDGDELDGYDEAICPMDSFQKGPILDDEINEVIVRPLVQGVRLHAIVDACHSATVLDLAFLCRLACHSATVLDLAFLCRLSRTGNWQWEDHRQPSGACKDTSGGQAMLIGGFSDGKSKFSMMAEAYASVGAVTHSFVKAVACESEASPMAACSPP